MEKGWINSTSRENTGPGKAGLTECYEDFRRESKGGKTYCRHGPPECKGVQGALFQKAVADASQLIAVSGIQALAIEKSA